LYSLDYTAGQISAVHIHSFMEKGLLALPYESCCSSLEPDIMHSLPVCRHNKWWNSSHDLPTSCTVGT